MYRQLYIALLRFLLIFGTVFPAFAQNYPVQVNVISSANALNYASFFADQNNHLTLAITLTDFNSDPIPVQLRLRFSGPATFYTNPTLIVGQPLILEPGMTEIVQGIDLAPYFQPANLIREPFNLNLNKLPSGYYTVCAEVIRTGVNQEVLSTSNCGMFSIADVQPPFLQFPACASALDTGLVFYPFNWTPAVNYFPVMGAELEYTFSLYNWFDPNNFSALQAAPFLIDEQTTSVNTVQVNEWDIPGGFQVGEKYLWRVRAQVLENGMDLKMIENNGFSQWCTFTYGQPITLQDALYSGLTLNLSAVSAGERKGYVSWWPNENTQGGLSNFPQFILEYRKKPLPGDSFIPEWFVDTVIAANNDFIYQLAPNTTYQVRIAGMSGSYVSERTDIVEFTTSSERDYQCGDQDFPARPTQFTPLENALTGIEVQIGQFYMTTTELFPTGTPGHYRGKGTIPIAFLLGARAKVRFNDILIDTEYTVREGTVEVMTDGVDEWLHDQYMQFIDPIYVDNVVSGITVDSASGSGWYIVDGQQINFTFNPPDYPIIVNDANGNSYTIWPNGDIDTSSYFNIAEEWDVSANDVVTFSQAQNEAFGFDGKQFVAWHENYEIMELADSSKYFVANKSLRTGQGDNVALTLPSSAGQVSFGYENGASGPPIAAVSSSGALSLPAFSSKGHYELYAYNASGKKIGKLNIYVYDRKQREVVIVPLTSVTLNKTAIENYLDATLGEAGINIDVTIAPQWNDATFTSSTNIPLPSEVGLLNKYSDQMRQLRDAYFDDSTITRNNDAYYVFVVNGFDDPSELGYMVRGRGMGFVKASQPDILLTIAHELGHGMGDLHHSWKNNGPAQGKTANLMDYSDSLQPNNLIKAQWKELRDVDVLPALFDNEEDFMSQLMALDFDDLPVVANTVVGSKVEQFLIDPEEAMRLPNGTFVKFSESQRNKFTHFEFFEGNLIALWDQDIKLSLQTTGYTTENVTGQSYSSIITGEVSIVVFFKNDMQSYTARTTKSALKGNQTIQVIDNFAPGDVTRMEFVTCNEIQGKYIQTIANGQAIWGQVDCPPEGTCNTNELLAIIPEDKAQVKSTFKAIIQSANGGYSWNPISFIGENHILDSEEKAVITDKIQTLNHYRNDVVVGVVGIKGFGKNIYGQAELDQIASEVVSELAVEFPQKQLVLYLNNYVNYDNSGLFFASSKTCMKETFAASNSTIVQQGFTPLNFASSTDAANSFFALFTHLKKPYYVTNIYEKFDGALAYVTINKTANAADDVYGLPYIHGAKHLISKNKAAYDDLQFDISVKLSGLDFQGSVLTFSGPNLEQIRQEYKSLLAQLETNLITWQQEQFANPTNWVEGEIAFDNIREQYLTEKIALAEFQKMHSGYEFVLDVTLASGGQVGGLSSDMYYDFDVWQKVIDPIVYTVVDVLGVVPGVDFIADGIGALYSVARGNGQETLIYSAALALPFAGAAVIHTGQKVFAYYAKRNTQATLDIVVKQWDEAHDGWVKISNDIPYDDANKSSIKAELETKKSLLDNETTEKVVELGKQAGSVAQSLTGYLKSSYDDLLTKGFSAVEEAGKIKFLDNTGRHLAEISNNKLIFKYGGFGGDVVITEGKVTTVLGKFAEIWGDINSFGTRRFLGSNDPVVLGFPNGSINRGVGSAIPNRMNFLDLPEAQYNSLINNNIKTELDEFLGTSSNVNLASQSIPDVKNLIKSSHPNLTTTQIDNIVNSGITNGNNAFWINYNLPFLEQAFQRGDDIRLVSDPINQLTRTGTYKRELEAIENTLANKYNYSYNSTTKTYYKN